MAQEVQIVSAINVMATAKFNFRKTKGREMSDKRMIEIIMGRDSGNFNTASALQEAIDYGRSTQPINQAIKDRRRRIFEQMALQWSHSAEGNR